jgi:hypothetical protein
VADGAGEGEVAVGRGRLDAIRHGDVQRQRVVRGRGQGRVVTVGPIGQHDLEVVLQFLDAGHAPGRRRRFQVLGIAGHGAVEGHVPVDVHHRDVRGVDQRVVAELALHRVADVLGLAHCLVLPVAGLVRIPYPAVQSAGPDLKK